MLKGSWKTTLAGVVMALGLLLGQIGAVLDEDPNTKLDTDTLMGAVLAIAGAVGLGTSARDNNVTSEQVGAK